MQRQSETFLVILKSLKAVDERIVLDRVTSLKHAEDQRKNWRRLLGGSKSWAIDRRPGLDTLDHLALTIEKVPQSSVQCPHCYWGFHPAVIDQHIREKHE